MAKIPLTVEILLHTRDCPDCRHGWACRWFAQLETEQQALAAKTHTTHQPEVMETEELVLTSMGRLDV